MNKETKYQKTGSVKFTVKLLLIYAIVQVFIFFVNPILFDVLIIFNVFLVIYGIFVLSGVLKGKIEIYKESKYLKKQTHIFILEKYLILLE